MYIDDEGMYLPMCYADSQINELSSVKTPIWYIIRTWFVYYLSIMEFIRNRSSIIRYLPFAPKRRGHPSRDKKVRVI